MINPEAEDALAEAYIGAHMLDTARQMLALKDERIRFLEDIIAEAQTLLWKASPINDASFTWNTDFVLKAKNTLEKAIKK